MDLQWLMAGSDHEERLLEASYETTCNRPIGQRVLFTCASTTQVPLFTSASVYMTRDRVKQRITAILCKLR